MFCLIFVYKNFSDKKAKKVIEIYCALFEFLEVYFKKLLPIFLNYVKIFSFFKSIFLVFVEKTCFSLKFFINHHIILYSWPLCYSIHLFVLLFIFLNLFCLNNLYFLIYYLPALNSLLPLIFSKTLQGHPFFSIFITLHLFL